MVNLVGLQSISTGVLLLLAACKVAPRLELIQADYAYQVKAGVVHGSLLNGVGIPVFNVTHLTIGGKVSDPAISTGRFRIVSSCGEVAGDFPIYNGEFSFDPSQEKGWFPEGCGNWEQEVRLILSVTAANRRSTSQEIKVKIRTGILD